MSNLTTEWTVHRLLAWCAPYLESKGVEKSRLDSELLLAHVLGTDRIWIYSHPEQVVADHLLEEFRHLIHRRALREPVWRIIGRIDFFRETYEVNEHVLLPRPETELLVEGALSRVKEGLICDVGTGSGCVLLSTLNALPEVRGLAVDYSLEALKVARSNCQKLSLESRVSFAQSDLLHSFGEEVFDSILSNPPYVDHVSIKDVDPEVRQYDPRLALDGGADGYDIYRALIPQAKAALKPGGYLGLEVGFSQASCVVALGTGAGFEHEETVCDYSQIERVVWLRKPTTSS